MHHDNPGYNGNGGDRTFDIAATTVLPLCEPNLRRTALVIQPHTGTVFLSMSDQPSATRGLAKVAGDEPLVLSRVLHGGMVTRGWLVTAGGGTATVYVAESFE